MSKDDKEDDEEKGWFGAIIEALVGILFFWAE